MRAPLPRPVLRLLWGTLRSRRTTPHPDPAPDPATLARQTNPALRRLYELHRPHTEHDTAPTVCFECGLPWPCRTRTTLDSATTLADCPHCDPEHQPPWNGSWGVYAPTDHNRRPVVLHVARPDGAHVSERDATWVRDVLTAAATDHHRTTTDLPQDEATARARDAATRAAQHTLALDLHQALNEPFDPADHPSFLDWWSHLLAHVRTATQHQAAPDLAQSPLPPRLGSLLYARVLDTLTRALADREHHLPLTDRQHLTGQLLHELDEDLFDADTVPTPGQTTLAAGRAHYLWCPNCHTRSRFHLTSYLTGENIVLPVGCVEVCTNCLHTPYQPTTDDD